MVEEAIRNGTYVDLVGKKQRLGTKPTLYDVYLEYDGAGDGSSEGSSQKLCWWGRILPVSATAARLKSDPLAPAVDKQLSQVPVATSRRAWYSFPWRAPIFNGSQLPPASPNGAPAVQGLLQPTSQDDSETSDEKEPSSPTSITFLIAMPAPPEQREKLRLAQKEKGPSSPISATGMPMDLPHLEFGIAEVVVPPDDSLK